jgi:hypothetical protein
MAIKGLYDNLGNASPTVGIIKIGVLMPTCCLRPEIYAESPETRKCVNDKEGECPFIAQKADFKHPHRNEKKRFEYTTKNTTCPAARMTTEQCVKKDFPTKPEKLPYFLMPDEVKLALGLDYRPTKIPNVMFMSNEIQEKRDPETKRIISYTEPEDVCRKYPISDAGLYYWTANDLCCFGDGEHATQFPSSPNDPLYNTARVCLYKECPDFKKHLCYEVGKLYFRIPNAPGFPGLWMLQTKSMKAMKGIVKELESYYWSYQQRISLMPMSLELRKEKASPEVNRKVDGEWTKVKTKTHVYRVHVVPATTMGEMQKALGQATLYLTGEVQTDIKALQAAAPKALPLPAEPIEEALATDTEDGEYEDIQQDTAAPTPETQQQQPAEPPKAKRGPKPKVQQPEVQQPPAPAVAPQSKPEPQPSPSNSPEAILEMFNKIEADNLANMSKCECVAELKAYMSQHKNDFALPEFKAAGLRPLKATELFNKLKATLPELPPMEEPDPKEPDDLNLDAKAPFPKEETAAAVNPLMEKILDLMKAGNVTEETILGFVNQARGFKKIVGTVTSLKDFTESDMQMAYDVLNA